MTYLFNKTTDNILEAKASKDKIKSVINAVSPNAITSSTRFSEYADTIKGMLGLAISVESLPSPSLATVGKYYLFQNKLYKGIENNGSYSFDEIERMQEKIVDPSSDGSIEVTPDNGYDGLSKVTVNQAQGGAELNIAYGQNPPENTNKLWFKTEEPDSVDIKDYLGNSILGETINLGTAPRDFRNSDVSFMFDENTIGYLYCYASAFFCFYKYSIPNNTWETVGEVDVSGRAIKSNCGGRSGNYVYIANSTNQDGYIYKATVVGTYSCTRLCQLNDSSGGVINILGMYVSGNDVYYIGRTSAHTFIVGKYLIYSGTRIIFKEDSSYDLTSGYSFSCDGNYYYYITKVAGVFTKIKISKDTGHVTELNATNTILDNVDYALYKSTSVLVDNAIYFFGGAYGGASDYTNKIFKYNITNDTLVEYGTMNTADYNSNVVATGGIMYKSGVHTPCSRVFSSIDFSLACTSGKEVILTKSNDISATHYPIVASGSLSVNLPIAQVYKGDSSDLAEKVEAYYYDEEISEWVLISE